MICSRGKQVIPDGRGGIYFICQYGEYKNRQCRWVKWCKEERKYESRTDDTGYLCKDFTTEIQIPIVEEPIIETKVVKEEIIEQPIVEKQPIDSGIIKGDIHSLSDLGNFVPEAVVEKKVENIQPKIAVNHTALNKDELEKIGNEIKKVVEEKIPRPEIEKKISNPSYLSKYNKK
jgi:hypothetical protein